ncbi:GlcG/HbpS family heme-binding protein [Rhodococcus qingshengii]|uniref:GlcG/HbpS family heme-binding protein n=1 Tax=Rhodococcus qingshengii TaxID=334542 RepID=UPI001BEB4557|nr:heme-binding protein [Rhodococcus qingshengii]MBT2269967.1 heme-binding protein [Rhodococcus qingshengii]
MREPLNYAGAIAAAHAVIVIGRERGLALSVSVVNRSGITKIVLADDGAGPLAVETSRRKAYTAALMGMPTDVFAQFAVDPKMAAAPPHRVDAQLLPAIGGLPIVVDGEVIGGIGVGGADGDTDKTVAIEALERAQSLW